MQQSSGQEGYITTTGTPPQDPGAELPHTGLDVTPLAAFGGCLLMAGVVLLAAVNGSRHAVPGRRGPVAPDYLRGGVVPSTFNQE